MAYGLSVSMDWVQQNEDGDDEFTLVEVHLVLTGGASVQLPVVRVPFASVNAWWIVPGKEVKTSSGGFFAMGGTFPVGD